MAVRAVVVTAPDKPAHHAVRFASWSGLLNGDSGAAFGEPSRSDRSVQVGGDFGTGGTVAIEGRNDPAMDWEILHDLQGNLLEIAEAAVFQVAEITAEIRPNVTAGDGDTDLTVIVTAKGDRDKV